MISFCEMASPRQPQSRLSILVVDDDPEVREIVVEHLEALGHHVQQAESGTDALHVLTTSGDVELLITDIRMPGMSGLELSGIAAHKWPDLKIILISGYFAPQEVGLRFLKKPFRFRDLHAAMEAEMCGGKASVPA